jgi:hypothetical protein
LPDRNKVSLEEKPELYRKLSESHLKQSNHKSSAAKRAGRGGVAAVAVMIRPTSITTASGE